jgi:hypothetical protein
MTDKITVADRTVRSFTTVEDWKTAVSENGHRVKETTDENNEPEYFAEKVDDEDVTMIGYFKDNWGMIV